MTAKQAYEGTKINQYHQYHLDLVYEKILSAMDKGKTSIKIAAINLHYIPSAIISLLINDGYSVESPQEECCTQYYVIGWDVGKQT